MFIFLVGAADVIVFLLFPLVVCLLLCPFALQLALSASPNEAHFDKLNELNNPVVTAFGGSSCPNS